MAESPLQHLDLLRRVPYFAGLTDEVLGALAGVAGSRHYARGQLIFLEGDPCAGLFIVAAGEVKIFKLSPGSRANHPPTGARRHLQRCRRVGWRAQPCQRCRYGRLNIVHHWTRGHSPPGARLSAARLGADREHPAAGTSPGERRRGSLAAVGEAWRDCCWLKRHASAALAPSARPDGDTGGDGSAAGHRPRDDRHTLHDLADEGLIEFDRHRIVIIDRSGLQAVSDSVNCWAVGASPAASSATGGRMSLPVIRRTRRGCG